MPEQKTSRQQLILISAGLVLLIGTAFEPLRHNAFIDFDDNSYIVNNDPIQSGFTSQSVVWAFTSGYAANWHPLTWLSHMLDIELFGLNPLGHHLHNLLLHTLSTVLLFRLLYRMTGTLWCSVFVAMAFGLHPLRVESVAWAAERKDVLSVFFFMLTLTAYLYYVNRGGLFRYLLVALSFTMGLMAKPMLVTAPVLLLILDLWPLGRNRQNSIARLIMEKIPLLVLSIGSCIVTYTAQQSGGSMAPKLLSWLPRLSNSLTSYIGYWGKVFWPSDLALLYPYHDNLPLWQPIISFLILAVVSGLVIYRFRKQPYLAAGWAWYLVTLLPVIGLVQVGSQSMADRYTYLPSIGIFIVVSWGTAHLVSGWRYQKLLSGISMLIIASAMIIGTRTQLHYWQNSTALFKHTLAVTHNNHIIHHSLGWVLAKQGNLDEAADHFNKALALWPDFPEANLDMASLSIKRNELDKAMNYLHRVLKLEPENATAYCNMGLIFESQDNIDQAIGAYEQAVRFDGNNYKAWNALGVLKANRGLLDEARDCFGRCIQMNPNDSESWRNLGFTRQMQNQTDEAVSCYRTALDKDPNNYQAWCNLAQSLQMTGKVQEATDACRRALRINPDSAEAMNNLAWILASSADDKVRNPAEAIGLARKACQMTAFEDPDNMDTLAAAYAAAGQFKEAIETAQKAITSAALEEQKTKADEISKRLQLYQTGKPYYDKP
jgi:protein O-mannosyl-transferase